MSYFKRTGCCNIEGYAKNCSPEYLHGEDCLSMRQGEVSAQKPSNSFILQFSRANGALVMPVSSQTRLLLIINPSLLASIFKVEI